MLLTEIYDRLYNIYGTLEDEQDNIAISQVIQLVQEKIDESESPCYECVSKHCRNCLYSGKLSY